MNIAAELIAKFESMRSVAAVVDVNGSTTTYGELADAIARGRTRVAASKLPDRSRVIVHAPKGVPFASATLALAAEGHTTVGIEMAQGDAVYADRAGFVEAAAVVSTGKVRLLQRSALVRRRLASVGIEVPPALDLPTIDWDAPAATTSAQIQPADDEHIALIIFTGGTTARPKGVQLSHRAVRFYLAGLMEVPEWPAVSSLVADHPQQVLYGLAHGKTVYLSPVRAASRAKHTTKLLFQQGVDCYFGSPVLWSRILDCGLHRSPESAPRAVLLGGAPVTRSLLERLERELSSSVSIRCLYGMSESGLVAHISGREKLARLRSDQRTGATAADPVGQVVQNVTVEVAADGELLVGSPSRFSGYVGEPLAAPDELFPTGDIGRLDEHGLSLHGRKKNMIVQQGVNLYPEQFEARLLQHQTGAKRTFEDVALVSGPPDHLGDEHFVLVYVSPSTDEATALKVCAQMLPPGHAPTSAIRLASLPRSGRQNKIDRGRLVDLASTRTLTAMQSDLLDRLVTALPKRSAARRRAVGLRLLTKRNLVKVQQLERAETVDVDPVFILGHQRSGTTHLHHALASSPTATAMTLADMLAPHPVGWKLAKTISPMTRRLLARATTSDRWAAALARHQLDLSNPEEEEWLLAALGLSGYLPSAFPATLGNDNFDDIRDRAAWNPATRGTLIDVYATIVRNWHRHRNDPTPLRHVAKNPAFGPLASELLQPFPTARFIVALRDPHDALCSRVALISAIHDRPLTEPETAVVVRDSVRQLTGLAEQVSLLPAHRLHLVPFTHLMKEPAAVIAAACEFANLAAPAALPEQRRSSPVGPPSWIPGRRELGDALPGFMRLFERVELTS